MAPIRFYGTPAEEAVGGKLYMVRAGLFDDVDVALAWHPSDEISADTDSSQALADFVVEFRAERPTPLPTPGTAAAPWTAVEVFTHAINLMREHVRPTARIHYVIADGGNVPNVVPDYAKLWCWVRDTEHNGVNDLLERARAHRPRRGPGDRYREHFHGAVGRLRDAAQLRRRQARPRQLHLVGPAGVHRRGAGIRQGDPAVTEVEQVGLKGEIKPLDLEPGPPDGGSTDVADVSWNVPTIHLSVTTAAFEAPWHAWPVVAAGGTSIGHKGMNYAAKTLAATMVDLYENPEARAAIEEGVRGEEPRALRLQALYPGRATAGTRRDTGSPGGIVEIRSGACKPSAWRLVDA